LEMEKADEYRYDDTLKSEKSKSPTQGGPEVPAGGEAKKKGHKPGGVALPAFSPIHPSPEGFPARTDDTASTTKGGNPGPRRPAQKAPIMMPKKKGEDLTPDDDIETSPQLGSISPMPGPMPGKDSPEVIALRKRACTDPMPIVGEARRLVIPSPARSGSKGRRRASTSIHNLPEGLNLGSKGEHERTYSFEFDDDMEMDESSESDYSPAISDHEDDDMIGNNFSSPNRMQQEALAMLADEAEGKMVMEGFPKSPNRLFVRNDSSERRTWSTTTIPDVPVPDKDDGQVGLDPGLMLVDSDDEEEEAVSKKSSAAAERGEAQNIPNRRLEGEKDKENKSDAAIKSAVDVRSLTKSPDDSEISTGFKKNRKSPNILVRKSSASRLKIRNSPPVKKDARKQMTKKKSSPENKSKMSNEILIVQEDNLLDKEEQDHATEDEESDGKNPYSRESMRQAKPGPQPVPNPSSNWLPEGEEPKNDAPGSWGSDFRDSEDTPSITLQSRDFNLPPRCNSMENLRKMGARKLSPLRNKPRDLKKSHSGLSSLSGSFRQLTVQEIINTSRSGRSSTLSAEDNLRQHEEMLTLAMEEISALHFENEVLNMKITQIEQDFNSQMWDLEAKKRNAEVEVEKLEEENRKQESEMEQVVSDLKEQMEQGLKQALAKIRSLEEQLQEERANRKRPEASTCNDNLQKSSALGFKPALKESLQDIPI